MVLIAAGVLSLSACAKDEPPPPLAAAPPPPPGALAGTTAADQDGDGVVDGFYTADGAYHPLSAPPPPLEAAPPPPRRGERG
jgi:hypothetical protein